MFRARHRATPRWAKSRQTPCPSRARRRRSTSGTPPVVEADALVDPLRDRLDPRPAGCDRRRSLEGERRDRVGLAVALGRRNMQRFVGEVGRTQLGRGLVDHVGLARRRFDRGRERQLDLVGGERHPSAAVGEEVEVPRRSSMSGVTSKRAPEDARPPRRGGVRLARRHGSVWRTSNRKWHPMGISTGPTVAHADRHRGEILVTTVWLRRDRGCNRDRHGRGGRR